MDIDKSQLKGLCWVGMGANSFVYEVNPLVVAKVPRSGDEEREQFKNELEVFKILSKHPPCPQIITCFLYTENAIFLEYMRDISLAFRIQRNSKRDDQTRQIISVERLEPLPLRKLWMNDITQAVAFLESLGLAHGDLRPENILIDRNRLKLSDFDSTVPIGSRSDGFLYPWGRVQGKEADSGPTPGFGDHGPRTEQFALGSVFYYINYGFAPYEDQLLGDDPRRHHGREVVSLLRDMVFPNLNGDPQLDAIIEKCWYNKYETVAELAAETQKLLEGIEVEASMYGDTDKPPLSAEDFQSRKMECEEFEGRGVLDILAAHEPFQLGIPLETRYDWPALWNR